MKICIIEDESAIVIPLQRSLEKAGFTVDIANDGVSGLRLVQSNSYDCVLLDLNLPELDGLGVMQEIRRNQNMAPVIMLTARSQVYDKVEGFEYGADDYVTKPFHLEELIARIRAVIKRSSANKSRSLEFGTYSFEPEKNQLVDNSSKTTNKTICVIELTTKETAILEYLLRHSNRIVSTEELLEHVWDREVDIFTDTVKTHIKTLRQKCDPDKKIILTVRGKGYTIQHS